MPDARGCPPARALVLHERALGELQPLFVLGKRAASRPAGEHVRAAERAGVFESFGDADRVGGDGEQHVRRGRPGDGLDRGPFESCARPHSGVRDVLGGGERGFGIGPPSDRVQRRADLAQQLGAQRAPLRQECRCAFQESRGGSRVAAAPGVEARCAEALACLLGEPAPRAVFCRA